MEELVLQQEDVKKLLAEASADAVLLYLHLHSGQPIGTAAQCLHLSACRLEAAAGELRSLSLLPETPSPAAQRPTYSDEQILRQLDEKSGRFKKLVGEVQRRYGRTLSTEELRCLLTMTDYLALPPEVVAMLLSFCNERARKRGAQRMPSLRMVEKEAFVWREKGIDTIELAASYMQAQLSRFASVVAIAQLLQITDRRLTPGEENTILSWLDLGFGEAEIRLAYERTCESIGTFKWNYAGSILKNWDAAGLHTVAEIQAADAAAPKQQRNAQYQRHGEVSPMGQQAIQRLLKEERTNGIQ